MNKCEICYPPAAVTPTPREFPSWVDSIPKQGIICWVWDGDENCKVLRIVYQCVKSQNYPFDVDDTRYANAVPATLNEIMMHTMEYSNA